MQPLNLPEDSHWRVIYVGRIELHPSKKYYTFEVTFERLEIPSEGGVYPKTFKSLNSISRKVNLNLIKLFALGSIWNDDKIANLADNFETYSTFKNTIDFRSNSFEIKAEDYIEEGFTPIKRIDGKKEISHSMLVIEDKNNLKFKYTDITTGKTLIYKPSFIAIPSYEIIRFFLMGKGIYNSKLIRSNLYDKSENLIFDKDEVYYDEDSKTLFIKLKSGITQENAITVADLCESDLYRQEAQKLDHTLLPELSALSKIQIPITKYSKITFKAKRVVNKNGEWGLFLLFFNKCIGHRNYETVVFDHEDSYRKRSNDPSIKHDNSSEDSFFRKINTGTPENFIEDENTNNSFPSIAIKSNAFMNDLLNDSDEIKVEKVVEKNRNNRPPKAINKPISTPDYGQKTEESASDNDVAPEDVKDGEKATIYDPSEKRDESDSSEIYPLRFFQDFEIIMNLMRNKLKEKSANVKVKFGNILTNSGNNELVFTLNPSTIVMKSLLKGTSTSNSFLKLAKSKINRKLYLIEVLIDSKVIYILEPEFKSNNNTATTLIFHGKTFQKQNTDQLFQFFKKYVENKGVKNRMIEDRKIKENFDLIAFNHDLQKTKSSEFMTVSAALSKHAQKLADKIISVGK